MNLVIVESPTKAKTIGKFLGKEYSVLSSYGHVRDLPRGALGVDTENDFEPKYVIPTKVRKRVNQLKKTATEYDTIILATDEDREGEAIAWHLIKALDLEDPKNKKNLKRIVFHEITKNAIKDAVANPRELDMRLVNAQQTRRILDRLVGYTLSPFLWKKIFRGLSAGRVQSVALRIISKREKERKDFTPQEYWSIDTTLTPDKSFNESSPKILAQVRSSDGKELKKHDIQNEAQAKEITNHLNTADYKVIEVEKKQARRNPSPPFTTSTLQQQASHRLRFGARQTMQTAQGLYEKGLITYMRTDSVNISSHSLTATKKWIKKEFGEAYTSETPRVFKNKSKGAQEAHEAIRPTDPNKTPPPFGDTANIKDDKEARLYELIWRRFIASQLPRAEFDNTTLKIEATSKKIYELRANGTVMKFDGFLKVWETAVTETILPDVSKDSSLTLVSVSPEQHFTEPPARYNEAGLIKTLEEHGIGRPSTYAPTISVIQTRNYVEKDERGRFMPTETGIMVDTMLAKHFPQIVDIEFTAHMEEELDEIAEGAKEWRNIIRNFYEPFHILVEKKYDEVEKIEIPPEDTDEVCDKCKKPMVVKIGRFGKFLGCSGFPDCKTTRQYITEANSFGVCPECNEGRVISRRTKRKRLFYGCSNYPDCTHAVWKKPKKEGEDENIEV